MPFQRETAKRCDSVVMSLSKTSLNIDRWYELLVQVAGSCWTNEETKALLRIWGAANVQGRS